MAVVRLEERRVVPRALDDVFTYTADFSNIERWDPGVATSHRLDDGPLTVGSSFDLTVLFGGSKTPMRYEVTELTSPERVVLVGQGGGLRAVDTIDFTPVRSGTQIDYVADLEFEGLMGRLAPFLKPMLRRVGRRALDGLAAALA